MQKLFSVIFMNFWGYDLIIFIAAIITAVIYYKLRMSADNLYNKMHLTVYVPNGNASRRETDSAISGITETDIVSMRNHTGKLYSVFVNLTGIFPLLGILGTVVSLLGLVADSTDVTGNFYGALTSTFWGLIFAIIFKFMDGIISAKIEDNEKTVALYLERNTIPGAINKIRVKRRESERSRFYEEEPEDSYDDEDIYEREPVYTRDRIGYSEERREVRVPDYRSSVSRDTVDDDEISDAEYKDADYEDNGDDVDELIRELIEEENR